ncbi:MAG: UDP-N-acetylmuramoyl-tripeptide--D-alanyl-D-alanine ligase [Chloroflexi bacterium]|nr:UDP-N-acetylmuramoyl-tripeptide--D-alanyl-D-alanine ligase [Chloroflexota bacterium]MDL1882060.1 UDP-N-acetylmuramoyl-tripeptide--D-alanyl-D-alanine ligase [Anaerolineae bacterium CFX8]
MDAAQAVILMIWLAGTIIRIYRQARFYQIEEYKSGRYLRWALARRDRWLPARPAGAWLVGLLLALFISDAPGSFVPGAVGVITGLIAVWPPDEGEVKKGFKATARAKRLLGAAFVSAAALAAVALLVIPRLPDVSDLRLVAALAAGFALWLLAPVWLVIGNLLMTPVEAAFRRQFVRRAARVLDEVQPTVIGITGSYGKTSTKTYLAHILNGRWKAYPTPKSYNTLMGVCLAINNDLAGDYGVDYFICEMGAYIPGEIESICRLTHPAISIVVEVGPQHLERFGSLENVARAKYEIIKALPPDGVGVFNWDNPYVRKMYERGYPGTRLAVSKTVNPADVPPGGPRFVASDIEETLDGLRFTVTDAQTGEREPFVTPLLGEHNVTNLLLAAAVAVYEGMPLRDVARRVRSLQPAESRLVRQMTPEGITIINDAYSANPVGAAYALRVLSLHQGGRRLLITPGMVELGPLMESENRKLGEIAAAHATDVILVGAGQTGPVKTGLLAAGFPPERLHVVDTLAEAVSWYQNELRAGDTVLFLNDLPDTYSS